MCIVWARISLLANTLVCSLCCSRFPARVRKTTQRFYEAVASRGADFQAHSRVPAPSSQPQHVRTEERSGPTTTASPASVRSAPASFLGEKHVDKRRKWEEAPLAAAAVQRDQGQSNETKDSLGPTVESVTQEDVHAKVAAQHMIRSASGRLRLPSEVASAGASAAAGMKLRKKK